MMTLNPARPASRNSARSTARSSTQRVAQPSASQPSTQPAPPTEDVLPKLLQLVCEVRLYHWATRSYARHRATDQLLASLDALVDRFVEAFAGRPGGREALGLAARGTTNSMPPLHLRVLTDGDAPAAVTTAIEALMRGPAFVAACADAPELASIRYDMLEALRRTQYLFSMS